MKNEIEYSKKYETAYLLFNMMSSTNNYNFVIKNYNQIKNEGKFYTILDNTFCAKYVGKYDIYRLLELINLASKYLDLLLTSEVVVEVPNIVSKDLILENLEFLDINCRSVDEKDNNIRLISNGKLLASILVNDNLMELTIGYDDLYKIKDSFLDTPEKGVEIIVTSEDGTSMDEVMLITTLLRDMSYRTEYIMDSKDIKDYDSEFIVKTSESLAKKYSVKLIDNMTKTEKIVPLNNLEEEIEYDF